MDLFPANGCVYSSGKGGRGFYALEGLNAPSGGGGLGGASGLGGGGGSKVIVIVDSATLRDSDLVSPMSGLGNSKVLYTVGTANGEVTIQGRLLLGPSGKETDGIKRIRDFFDQNRVYKSKKAVNLSVPGSAYKVYLTDFALGAAIAPFNIQQFAISGILADPLS